MADLDSIARALPQVEQGLACAGTALESRTYRICDKAFLFVSRNDARLKLSASAAEARTLGFVVGANGWVTLPLEALPTKPVLVRWIAESHSLLGKRAPPRSAKEGARPAKKKKSSTRRQPG